MDYTDRSFHHHHPTFRDFWAKEAAINAFLQNTVNTKKLNKNYIKNKIKFIPINNLNLKSKKINH